MQASIVVRSYNRLPALCELLERLLSQKHESFEIVVVEQSTRATDEERARLDSIARDSRVRILRHAPLGGARARNVGVEAARGEFVLFVDDDDLVLGEHWIDQHLANYKDPKCLAVSGRQVRNPDGTDPADYPNSDRAFRRCQMFSRFLKIPWTYCRQTRRKVPVDCLIGTNGSMRRSCYRRFGGWDTDTTVEDEASFGYRAQRMKEPGEYFAYDPVPLIYRRQDVPGGLAKRYTSATRWFERMLEFVHRIVGRYFPTRVVALYPVYVLAVYGWTLAFIWDESNDYRTFAARAGASLQVLTAMPFLVGRGLWRLATQRAGARGEVVPIGPLPVAEPSSSGSMAARRAR
jgi:glycosyltransferase involved in cell wall biosynthesis